MELLRCRMFSRVSCNNWISERKAKKKNKRRHFTTSQLSAVTLLLLYYYCSPSTTPGWSNFLGVTDTGLRTSLGYLSASTVADHLHGSTQLAHSLSQRQNVSTDCDYNRGSATFVIVKMMTQSLTEKIQRSQSCK